MTSDRGQQTGGKGESIVVAILIVGVVAYVGLDMVGINLFEILLYVGAALLVIIAALAAYGAWLIGRGSDAELDARARASQRTVDRLAAELKQTGQGGFRDRPDAEGNSAVMSTGWLFLDKLRTGDIPIVSTIEGWLGRDDDGENE